MVAAAKDWEEPEKVEQEDDHRVGFRRAAETPFNLVLEARP